MSGWLTETMSAVTLLMLLVLAVRRPVAHLFGAGWAYALWFLPLLRIILPPLNLFSGGIPALPMTAPFTVTAVAPYAPAISAAPGLNWELLLLAVWIGGAGLILLWQVWAYFAFLRRVGIGSANHAPLTQDIGILESPEVDGPLAIGIIDRWIVVPTDFVTRYTPQEQRLALQHERTHHQRRDLFWNMIALGVLALNWFNPIAYLAFRAFRTDQELSCDAVVAARATREERHYYALALVKSSSTPGLIAACPLNHAGQLKQRLRMMKGHRRSRTRAVGGSMSVAAVLVAGISLTETATVAAPEASRAVLHITPAAISAVPPMGPSEIIMLVTKSVSPPSLQPPVAAPKIAPKAQPLAKTVPRSPKVLGSPAQSQIMTRDAPTPPAKFVVMRIDGAPTAEATLLFRKVRVFRTDVNFGESLPAAVREQLERAIEARRASGSDAPVQVVRLMTVGRNQNEE